MRASRPPCTQTGIALIAVLWLTILLTVIASGFAYSMHGEAVAARNSLSLARARAAADGAVERTAFELIRPRNLPEVWQSDGSPQTWAEDDIKLTTWAVDESSRIDLNTASDALLKGLLQNVGGLDPFAADSVLAAIQDWRDPDDLKRPNGAEEADYRAAGKKYRPANAPFDSVGELARVLGVTPVLMARLADSVTVYSRQPGINPATATRDVLLSIPNVTPEVVDAYIVQRAEALASKLPVPPFPQAQGFASGAAPVWRIRAEASMPDGVTFVRDAVLRPSVDPRRPVIALLWQEGARTPPPAPNADAAARAATDNNHVQPNR
jgi:general secretion pathway protein K